MVQRRYCCTPIVLIVAMLTLLACGSAPLVSDERVPTQVEVHATEYGFMPRDVAAKVGQPITIVYVNDGAIEHDWAVFDLLAYDVNVQMDTDVPHPEGSHEHSSVLPDVHIAAMPGQHGELVFTPEKAGRYTIVCTINGHKEAGMVGTLTVVE